MTGGIYAGVGLLHGNAPIPGPLFKPRKLKAPVAAEEPAWWTPGARPNRSRR